MDQPIEVLFVGKQNQRRFPDLCGEENVVMLGRNGELEDGREFLREMAGEVPMGLFGVYSQFAPNTNSILTGWLTLTQNH